MTQPQLHGNALSDDVLLQAYEAFILADKNKSKAAADLGIPRKTFEGRLVQAFARNIDQRYADEIVPPGSEIVEEKHRVEHGHDGEQRLLFSTVRTRRETSGQFEMPPKWAIEKSTVQVDGNGDLIQQWARIKPEFSELVDFADAARAVIEGLVEETGFGAPARGAVPTDLMPEYLSLRILPDMHLGQFSWGRETGVDWDLKKAVARYQDVMTAIDAVCPRSETCVILSGGDFLHADNKRNETDRSKNPLDVDTRHDKVKQKALHLLVFQIELARAKHKKVIVRILPGNHDEMFAGNASWFLHAWYRNDPEVVIDLDPGEWWFFEWGASMLAANHGHKVKWTEIPRVMSTYQREMWGRTKFAYSHGFHIHHYNRMGWEEGGVKGETHQAATPPDAFHASGGYADSGISMPLITYHIEKGEQGRWNEPVFY